MAQNGSVYRGGCSGALARLLALVVGVVVAALVMAGALKVSTDGAVDYGVIPQQTPTNEPAPAAEFSELVSQADAVSQVDAFLSVALRVGVRLLAVLTVLSLGVALVVLPLRLALSGSLAGDALAFVSALTGNWEPPEPAPAPAAVKPAAKSTSAADTLELIEFCQAGMRADSWQYDKMRGQGWPGGAQRWQVLMQRVASDGFAFKLQTGKRWRWEPKGTRPFLSALSHYGSILLGGKP